MKHQEILLTSEYVWFFCSDPPNNAHNHFDMSVPSGTFHTGVSSDQRELYHACLGEGGGPGGRKFLKIRCWSHLFGHHAESLDCSAKLFRAHHSSCIAHPACRQRQNTGPGHVLGHSSGMVISHEESECLQVLLFPRHIQWNVQSVETMMPANTSLVDRPEDDSYGSVPDEWFHEKSWGVPAIWGCSHA